MLLEILRNSRTWYLSFFPFQKNIAYLVIFNTVILEYYVTVCKQPIMCLKVHGLLLRTSE